MAEEGLPPKEATRKSMGQIQGAWSVSRWYCRRYSYRWPSLAVLLVLSIVSSLITIVSAMALSVLVALILTPASCATMLKPIAKGDHGEGKKRLLRLV